MESQKSWYNLKLSNKNALKENWKFPEEPLVQGQWTFQSKDIFNSSWIKYCESKGIHLVGDVMLFYKAPLLNSHRAHNDINESDHTTWALNWCLDDDSGTMYWYEQPTDEIEKIYPSKDARYIEWDTRKLNLIDQKDIKQDIVLCRVDLPHSIKVSKKPRWCISVRAWLGEEKMPEWETVVGKMKELKLI
jgi:hypothetical protein